MDFMVTDSSYNPSQSFVKKDINYSIGFGYGNRTADNSENLSPEIQGMFDKFASLLL